MADQKLVSATSGEIMKLYLLYLLITAIAVMAHLGARETVESEADKAAV